jgi:hypothetical protein
VPSARIRSKVNLDPTTVSLLDAIAEAIGDDELVPRPSRSDLINKAALLYIERAKRRRKLRRAIERVEASLISTSASKIKQIREVTRRVASDTAVG